MGKSVNYHKVARSRDGDTLCDLADDEIEPYGCGDPLFIDDITKFHRIPENDDRREQVHASYSIVRFIKRTML